MIALDDLLYTGGRTVEPEIMLGVGEDADVGFELRRSGRHGRMGGMGFLLALYSGHGSTKR